MIYYSFLKPVFCPQISTILVAAAAAAAAAVHLGHQDHRILLTDSEPHQ